MNLRDSIMRNKRSRVRGRSRKEEWEPEEIGAGGASRRNRRRSRSRRSRMRRARGVEAGGVEEGSKR